MEIDIEKREDRFDDFVQQRIPVLVDFAELLGFQNAHEILTNPMKFSESIDAWLAEQEIDEDDRVWLATRIGYYIGEYFAVNYSGCWSLCKKMNSRYFGYYVIDKFDAFKNKNALLDPMGAAIELVSEPRGRSLKKLINEIYEALSNL